MRMPMMPPSAVLRSSIMIQRPLASTLLVAHAGIVEQGQTLGQPLFLAADGLGIVAALDADAQGVGQPDALAEEVGGLW